MLNLRIFNSIFKKEFGWLKIKNYVSQNITFNTPLLLGEKKNEQLRLRCERLFVRTNNIYYKQYKV